MKYRIDYNLLISLVVVSVIMVFAFINNNNLVLSNNEIINTYKAISLLDEIMNNLVDAETGQRGYLLTGKNEYLDPYEKSITRINPLLRSAEVVFMDNKYQLDNFKDLKVLIDDKLLELKETITVPKQKAINIINKGDGKNYMDDIRYKIAEIKTTEDSLLIHRINNNYNIARRCLLFFPIAIVIHIILTNISLALVLKERSDDKKKEY